MCRCDAAHTCRCCLFEWVPICRSFFSVLHSDWDCLSLIPLAAHELELPPCTREDRYVKLSAVERLCYEQVGNAQFCAINQSVNESGSHAVACKRRTGCLTRQR